MSALLCLLLAALGGVGHAAYVGLGLSCCLLVCVAVTEFGASRVAGAVGLGALMGALVQCGVSGLQLGGHDLGGAIMPKLYNAVYGNIAQPNHFGNLLWLGQASLIYLWGTRRLEPWLALVLTAVISLFAAMSASRAVWLYTTALPVLCGLYAWRRRGDDSARLMAQASLVVAGISVGMQLLMAFSDLGKWLGVVSSASRTGDASSNGQRLFDWMVAWQTGLDHPWTGAGAGMFAWRTALHSIGLPPPDFIRIGENAHNTPLHLLAEFGWPLTLLICGGLAWWLLRRWMRASTPEALWGFMILGVIGAHSMVEYPLWYTYFLIPAGLAMGMIAAAEPRGEPGVTFSSRWLLLPTLFLGVGLVWSMRDYLLLEKAYARFPYGAVASEQSFVESRDVGARISDWSLLALHARSLQIRAWPPEREEAATEVVGLCDRYLRYKPNFQTLTQCALAYGQAGREAEAVQAGAMVCGAYPAIYHGRFPTDLAAIFQRQGWAVRPEMYCIR